MKSLSSLGFIAALALGGCSETNFADFMGAGKYSSNESQVHTGNNLAMPPDLQLDAPGTRVAAAPTPTTGAQAASVPTPVAGQTAAAAPPPAAAAEQDVYVRYGISKTNPDGTEKTKQQLWKELRAAQLAEKRRTNPNYGTIFNIGNIFSDG
jgi:hypothetical protein